MKILITGANGFLGKYLFSELNPHFEIITLSRNNSDINCDLTQSQPILPNVDLVIHAAGKAHLIPISSLQKSEFYKTNVIGTQNLLKGLELSGIPKMLVYISSVSVYGLVSGHDINESADLKARDPYGLSKIEAENIIKNWCKKNKVKYTILRLPLIIGMNPPGNLNSMIHGIKNNYYFNIAGGTAKKSMVLASDVAKNLIKAAEVGGTYNLTDGCHPNFFDLSHSIANQLGKKFLPNMPMFMAKILGFIGDIFERKFPFNSNKLYKIISTLTFDDSKARKAFGWNPKSVLNEFEIHE